VLLGLGSILGTGVFVAIGLAAGVAGSGILLALALAAVLAICNGLASAQLAAAHPISGGTYEYGYRVLHPAAGFVAGWMFLCAKTASAATAALGFAGYLLGLFGRTGAWPTVAIGLGACVLLTAVAAGGLTRSNRTNAVLVAITLFALGAFVVAGWPTAMANASTLAIVDPGRGGVPDLLHATALMFVAYTGYARIATLGEEVHEPRRTIPRAVVLTLLVSFVVYLAVAFVAVGSFGADRLAEATRTGGAPLETIARELGRPGLAIVIAVGAAAAMLGVVLNLLLGLSRVWLAMARRGDMPRALGHIHGAGQSPRRAVLLAGACIAALVVIGRIETTWSFSAFTVLVYYAITNVAAMRLPPADRRVPQLVPVVGLLGCLGLAVWVEPAIWAVGLGLVAIGLVWHAIARRP